MTVHLRRPGVGSGGRPGLSKGRGGVTTSPFTMAVGSSSSTAPSPFSSDIVSSLSLSSELEGGVLRSPAQSPTTGVDGVDPDMDGDNPMFSSFKVSSPEHQNQPGLLEKGLSGHPTPNHMPWLKNPQMHQKVGGIATVAPTVEVGGFSALIEEKETGSVQTRHGACGHMLTVEYFVQELCSSRGGKSCLIVCRPRPFAGYEFVNIQDARRAYRYEERPGSMVVAIDSYGWVMRHEGSEFWVKNIVTGERLDLPALFDIPEVARGTFLIEAEGHLHAVVAYLDDDQGLQVFYHNPNSNNWRGHHYNVLGVNENSRVGAVLIYGGKIHIFFENQYMSLSPNPQAPNGVRVKVDLLIGADAIHPICTSFVIADGSAYLFLLDGNFAYRFYRINEVIGRLDLVSELGGAIYVADGSSTGVSIPHRTSFEENKTFIAGMRTPGEPREECCEILRTTQITSTLKECMDLICNCNVVDGCT